MKKNGKILYYPVLPDPSELGAERSDDVREWVERFLIPSGLVSWEKEKTNARLVAGGDGLLVRTAREEKDRNTVIVGVNCGRRGFLHNPITQINQIPKDFTELDLILLKLIRGTFVTRSGDTKTFLAFNDVFCGRTVLDYFTFNITGTLSHYPARYGIEGNGIAISTPQGSTGYALKNCGSSAVLPLDTKNWIVTGMSTGPYPCDQVSPQKITVEVIEPRESVFGSADGKSQVVEDIKTMTIEPTNRVVTLGFLKNIDFAAKRTQLAQKVERGEI